MVAISANFSIGPSNFTEFYAYYLLKHQHKWCRRLHFLGTAFGTGITAFGAVTRSRVLCLAGVITGLTLCIGSDTAIQRIKPTLLEYPLWSFMANVKMIGDMITGKLRM